VLRDWGFPLALVVAWALTFGWMIWLMTDASLPASPQLTQTAAKFAGPSPAARSGRRR